MRYYGLVEAQWRDAIDDAIALEELIANKKSPGSQPPLDASTKEALCWHYEVYLESIVLRAMSLVCAGMSIMFVWSEITLPSNTNLSPWAAMLDAVRSAAVAVVIVCSMLCSSIDRPTPGSMAILLIWPLTYIMACLAFSMFRVRLAKYYHMHGRARTEENSLLFNASYLMRLSIPLGYNFISIMRPPDTAFADVMGKMEVIPFLGGAFNDFMPVLIALFCLATFFNVYARILRMLNIVHFEHSEDFNDDMLAEGKLILRKEKRKRGVRSDPSNTSLL